MRQLVNLSLDEVSAVDEPANPGARVLLMKRQENSGDVQNRYDTIQAEDDRVGLLARLAKHLGVRTREDGSITLTIEKEEGRMADDTVLKGLQAKVEKLEAENTARAAIAKAKTVDEIDAAIKGLGEDVQKALTDVVTDAKARLEKAKGQAAIDEFAKSLPATLREPFAAMDPKDRDAFMKRYQAEAKDDPVAKALETVTKANEALTREVQKLKDRDEVRGAEAEFADLDGVVKVADFAKMVVRLRKADREAADALVEQTRQTAKVAKAGNLFKSFGFDAAGESGAEVELEKAVKKYREAHPEVTEAVATDAVLQAQPDLYTRINEEVH